jgi:hypothetical protein
MKGILPVFISAVICLSGISAFSEDTAPSLVTGHSIKMDNNIGDWIGLPPVNENTWCVDKGEYIWKDAKGDDKGAGNYTYGKNEKVRKGADIREFRVTFDDKRIYFLIKTDRPNDWWVGYRLIAIDRDGYSGGREGSTVLGQGDIDELDTYNGCYGELGVAEDLACEFVIGVASTYKGRIWDSNGRLIARVEGQPNDTPGFKVGDANWYAMEIAVPFSIIGDPRGKTWRFIVATGLQDSDHFREIYRQQDDWHGGGSKDPTQFEDGSDPDAYDLIGASPQKQVEDLASYKPYEDHPDPKYFCVIKNSFVTVHFAGKDAEKEKAE